MGSTGIKTIFRRLFPVKPQPVVYVLPEETLTTLSRKYREELDKLYRNYQQHIFDRESELQRYKFNELKGIEQTEFEMTVSLAKRFNIDLDTARLYLSDGKDTSE